MLKCLIIKSLFLQKLNNFSLLIITLIFITTHFHCTQKNETINLQEGDLLLQDLDSSPLCDAIEQVTNGFNNQSFSHIGIVLMLHDTLHVLEAFNRGVNIVTLDEFLNRSVNKDLKPKVLVGRVKKEYSYLIPKAIEHGIKLIGKEYDPEFKINNDKFYCSELIYEIFHIANGNNTFFKLEPMTYQLEGETLLIWKNYFRELNIPIPEQELGINPGGISLSEKIDIIHNYQN